MAKLSPCSISSRKSSMFTPVLPSLVLLWARFSSTEQSEPDISISLWLNPPGYVTNISIPAALLQAQDFPLQQSAHCWAVCEHQSPFHWSTCANMFLLQKSTELRVYIQLPVHFILSRSPAFQCLHAKENPNLSSVVQGEHRPENSLLNALPGCPSNGKLHP